MILERVAFVTAAVITAEFALEMLWRLGWQAWRALDEFFSTTRHESNEE